MFTHWLPSPLGQKDFCCGPCGHDLLAIICSTNQKIGTSKATFSLECAGKDQLKIKAY